MEVFKEVVSYFAIVGGFCSFLLAMIRVGEFIRVKRLKHKSIRDKKKQEALFAEFQKLQKIFGEKKEIK